jgi:hypothetical protein
MVLKYNNEILLKFTHLDFQLLAQFQAMQTLFTYSEILKFGISFIYYTCASEVPFIFH